jgi:uncharacterized alkaline shock family protein YloU
VATTTKIEPTTAKTTTPDGAPAATTEVTGEGRTVIAEAVIAKVAGIAAREVAGVHALGGNAARAIGALRQAIGNADLAQGVSVEVGETQVAADVSIVVAYPQPMRGVADDVRAAVRSAIEDLVGMEAAEINVTINDVYIPGDDDPAEPAGPAAPRVS